MRLRNDPKCTQTLCDAPKHEFRVQWSGLVRSLQKIPTWLCATYFCINCTNSHCFAPSFMQFRNDLKCTQTLCNTPKHEIGVGLIGCVHCEKSRRDFVARNFALLAPVHPVLHRVSSSYEIIPNAPKHYEAHQNMRLGSNGLDQVRSLRKITTWLPATNFCINWTSLICFATSFMQSRYDPKCTQILRNAPKH